MKKIALLLCAAMIVSLTVVFVSAGGVGETSTASYATTPPVIDGEIDEIWSTTAKQALVCDADGLDITAAYKQNRKHSYLNSNFVCPYSSKSNPQYKNQ